MDRLTMLAVIVFCKNSPIRIFAVNFILRGVFVMYYPYKICAGQQQSL